VIVPSAVAEAKPTGAGDVLVYGNDNLPGSPMSSSVPMPAWLRFVLGPAVLIATCAATAIEFPPDPKPPAGEPTLPQQVAVPAKPPTAAPQRASLPPFSSETPPQTPMEVVQWGFGNSLHGGRHSESPTTVLRGGRVYFWMTLDGTQAAVERLRAEGELAIQVHWTHEGADTRVTELTVGRRGLTPYFADQVRKKGHFEWHSWARKDVVSRGRWTVSLTYIDGQPVLCGRPAIEPCRFTIDVG
jgi:hypothetical protein